jgi:hypothetical protein
MFQYSYTPYLSVSFHHPYYFNGVTNDFQLLPTQSTQEHLDAFGLRFKNIAGTFFIYQQLDESGVPFQAVDAVTDLYFIVTPTSNLYNITQRFGTGQYFLSNLRLNGTYSTVLTAGPQLSIADQLPPVTGQQLLIEFLPDTITKITVSRIVAGTGLEKIQEHTIAPTDLMILIGVSQPGLYQVEKTKKAGGVDTSLILFSEELKRAGNAWAFVHLQIKPPDILTNYTADLPAGNNFWQYFIIEPEGRNGGVLTPSKLSVKCVVGSSRYPPTLQLLLQDPATYTAPVKDRVNALKSLPRIRDVYLFQSNTPLSLVDGEQPKLRLLYDTNELAGKMATPTRDSKDTILIYKL